MSDKLKAICENLSEALKTQAYLMKHGLNFEKLNEMIRQMQRDRADQEAADQRLVESE